MESKVTVPMLQQMKRDGRKIVGVVAYDYQIAQIVDRAGVDIVSVGDSVGSNMWGQSNLLEVTMDQMVLACQAVRRGVKRALVSCDISFGPVQESTEEAVRAAVRLVKEGGADMVKLDAAADFPEAVRAVVRAGVPVFAQFGITPQTAQHIGGIALAGADLGRAALIFSMMSGFTCANTSAPLKTTEQQIEIAAANKVSFLNMNKPPILVVQNSRYSAMYCSTSGI